MYPNAQYKTYITKGKHTNVGQEIVIQKYTECDQQICYHGTTEETLVEFAELDEESRIAW